MKTHRSLRMVLPLLAVASMLTAFSPLPVPAAALTDSEADGLACIREEERLAHDLYVVLYDLYGLPDPAQGMPPGEFSDPTLQALHGDLLPRGRESVEKALCVAALVEEADILALQERLAQTTQPHLTRAYQNLLQASGNHLRAFAMQIGRQTGVENVPQLLDAAAYASLAGGTQPGGQGAAAVVVPGRLRFTRAQRRLGPSRRCAFRQVRMLESRAEGP